MIQNSLKQKKSGKSAFLYKDFFREFTKLQVNHFYMALSSLFIHLGGLSKTFPIRQPIGNCIIASKSPFLVYFVHFGFRSRFAAIRHNLTEPRHFSQWKCRKLAAETQFWVKNTERLDRAVEMMYICACVAK